MKLLSPETADLLNGIFEAGGAVLVWKNVHQIIKDKQTRGVYWPAWFFFSAWGWWNILYYASLDQWVSWTGGLVLVLANTTWVVLAWKYRHR